MIILKAVELYYIIVSGVSVILPTFIDINRVDKIIVHTCNVNEFKMHALTNVMHLKMLLESQSDCCSTAN